MTAMTALATSGGRCATGSGWPAWSRASASALSSTAWRPGSAWPATSATTPKACSSRSRAPRRRWPHSRPAWSTTPHPWPGSSASTPWRSRRVSERRLPDRREPGDGAVRTFVSPDVAVCDDCLAEMFDPADRRFRYPFINCTNCGPRFTITLRLPYDRPNTTMARLRPCDACAAGVPRPRGPPVPRPARGLCGLRPPAVVRRARRRRRRDRRRHRRRPAGAGRGRHRRHQGPRRLPPGL